MPPTRLRAAAVLLASGFVLSACAYGDGYGYGNGGVSVGYGSRGCDPYWDDCYYGQGYDPWYGWYGDYYYPGIGFYVFDRFGRRYTWSDDHRRYWEGRRNRWGERNWNDRRWERWEGYRGDGRDYRRDGRDHRRDWRRDGRGSHGDRSYPQQWNENPQSFRRQGMPGTVAPGAQAETRMRRDAGDPPRSSARGPRSSESTYVQED
jgi:hypothetical protein